MSCAQRFILIVSYLSLSKKHLILEKKFHNSGSRMFDSLPINQSGHISRWVIYVGNEYECCLKPLIPGRGSLPFAPAPKLPLPSLHVQAPPSQMTVSCPSLSDDRQLPSLIRLATMSWPPCPLPPPSPTHPPPNFSSSQGYVALWEIKCLKIEGRPSIRQHFKEM
jgi:hypothetical protein